MVTLRSVLQTRVEVTELRVEIDFDAQLEGRAKDANDLRRRYDPPTRVTADGETHLQREALLAEHARHRALPRRRMGARFRHSRRLTQASLSCIGAMSI